MFSTLGAKVYIITFFVFGQSFFFLTGLFFPNILYFYIFRKRGFEQIQVYVNKSESKFSLLPFIYPFVEFVNQ